MPIIALIFIIMLQVFFTMLSIISITVFKDNAEILGIPVHLLILIILNFISLAVLTRLYQKDTLTKLKMTEKTYESQFKSLMASIRSTKHDANNHLTVLLNLMKLQRYTEAEQYMKQLVGDTQIHQQLGHVESSLLASMLFVKMERFKQADVTFTCEIMTEDITRNMSATDLIRLLTNLLDNAFDATVELPIEQRSVSLALLDQDNKLVLIVKNSSPLTEFESRFFDMEFSTKKHSATEERGYGLSIIQEIVAKYNATLSVTVQNGVVCFDIRFVKSFLY